MSIRPEAIQQLQDEVQKLIDEMTRLNAKFDAGACRFHCRTAKENWKMGYRYAAAEDGIRTADNIDAEEAYHEWKRQQASSDKDD